MLPDTSFRSLFQLTGMTTCGFYSQPEDTEMILALFDTCSLTLTTSVCRERPEVIDGGQADAIDPQRTLATCARNYAGVGALRSRAV